MADDISKVYLNTGAATLSPVRRVTASGAECHCQCHKNPNVVHVAPCCRLESATTPAAVDEDWQLIDGHRSPDGMTYTATYWCANTGALKTETTSDGRFRAGEGPRIRRPTLARQLAEAKASSPRYHVVEAVKLGNSELVTAEKVDALKMTNLEGWRLAQQRGIQLEQAESQLAEATRRLGEVEGLVNDALALQQKHYGDGMDTHMALADWARNAKAAIDARLASDSATGEGEGNG